MAWVSATYRGPTETHRSRPGACAAPAPRRPSRGPAPRGHRARARVARGSSRPHSRGAGGVARQPLPEGSGGWRPRDGSPGRSLDLEHGIGIVHVCDQSEPARSQPARDLSRGGSGQLLVPLRFDVDPRHVLERRDRSRPRSAAPTSGAGRRRARRLQARAGPGARRDDFPSGTHFQRNCGKEDRGQSRPSESPGPSAPGVWEPSRGAGGRPSRQHDVSQGGSPPGAGSAPRPVAAARRSGGSRTGRLSPPSRAPCVPDSKSRP
jgi:hypothetical protein